MRENHIFNTDFWPFYSLIKFQALDKRAGFVASIFSIEKYSKHRAVVPRLLVLMHDMHFQVERLAINRVFWGWVEMNFDSLKLAAWPIKET
jgi:hypothetical protein